MSKHSANSIKAYAASISQLLEDLGANTSSDEMKDTPKRWVKAMGEMLDGYGKKVSDHITLFENDCGSELVILRDIPFISICAHHMLPFEGIANVAYVPESKIVGLSKIARIVDIFAHRLQVQERLTDNIASAMFHEIQSQGSYVVIRAEHACMRCRGIRKAGAMMLTDKGYGCLATPSDRESFSLLLTELIR